MAGIIYLAEKHRFALTIKARCEVRWNLGAICYSHTRLDLQNMKCKGGRYLIGEIATAGGNFTGLPGYKPANQGASHCWSGSAYQGGAPFKSIGAAVKYLKLFFPVCACQGNARYHQDWIDKQ
jgi:hypothetical protein